MTKKKIVPQLKKKARHTGVDPESLVAALHWDRLSDPGDGGSQEARKPKGGK